MSIWVTYKELCRLLRWSERRKVSEVVSQFVRFSVEFRREDGKLIVDIETIPRDEFGVSLKEFLSFPEKFITLSDYSRKYGVPTLTVSRWLRDGTLKGIKFMKRVLVLDEPPQVDIQDVVFSLKELLGGRPVGLIKLPRKFNYTKYISVLKKTGLLFRHIPTGDLFFLVDPLKGDKIKERFPSPKYILFPEGESFGDSWDEFEPFSSS